MSTFKTYLKAMSLAAGCLFVVGLYAAEEDMEEEGMMEEEVEELPPLYISEVEIGIGGVDDDSFKFGEYNGLEDSGAFFIGNIMHRKNAVIGDDDNNYWEFSGTNLGLDNRNIFAEYSHDGTYGEYSKNSPYSVYFEYDQIPHNQFDDGLTPFNGAGTTNQTLPAGWTAGTSTGALTDLNASLKTIELETERKRYGGGFDWSPLDGLKLQANYRHEDKEGSDPMGAIFGNSGGNPRGSVISVPIDYDVDEFNISLAYTDMKAQVSLDYHLSLFDNNDSSVFFTNPFNTPARGWDFGASYDDSVPPPQGQLGQFADNEAHQLKLSGGYNFTPKTRATATVSYSWWLQDDNYLPFSNVFPADMAALPRSDLDGEIDTLFANVNLFHRVNNKLDLKARFTYDDQNNDTPRDTYVRIAGDSQTQPAPGATSGSRVNWNYEMQKLKVELDGNYRISPRVRMSLGFDYESKDRVYSEVEDTDEYTGRIKISFNPVDYASGWVKYSHSVRDASTYVSNEPFLTGHDPAYIATLTGDDLYENDPLMRKYHLADRDRDMLNGTVSVYPIENYTFTLSGHYKRDDYDNTEIGLQESKNTMVTLDLNYQPSDIINTYAWISRETYDYDQRGFRRTGSPPVGPGFDRDPAALPNGWDFWTTDTEDSINTFGTGIDWNVIENKFDLKLDFTYSSANTSYDQWGGPNINDPPVQLPDVTTKLLDLTLTGDYTIKENMTARFKYMYERMDTEDFSLDGVDPDTLSNIILMGQDSPNYNAHVVGLSLIYKY
jgi:MtrB/PioB family decaheme-associated outer membrane protein